MTTWQHTICCLWPSLKCLKCSHASIDFFFFFLQHSLWPDISIKILISLSNVLFALPLVTNLRIRKTHSFNAPLHQDSLPFSGLSCCFHQCSVAYEAEPSIWVFFFFLLLFSDWPAVDSLGAIVLLVAARPSALYSASLHNLPRCVCLSSVSHRSVRCSWKLHHALLWLAVKVVIACTPCLTVVCFYLSQKLHNVVTGDYRCTVFSRACA